MSRRRLLIVEDEYLLAEVLRRALEAAGATVIGPVASLGAAIATVDSVADIDAAVLDVNLAGQAVYPVAEKLLLRGVPFVFVTGYERAAIPKYFARVPVLEKPVDVDILIRMLDAG
jgi:CheY-like chemotaxis protein